MSKLEFFWNSCCLKPDLELLHNFLSSRMLREFSVRPLNNCASSWYLTQSHFPTRCTLHTPLSGNLPRNADKISPDLHFSRFTIFVPLTFPYLCFLWQGINQFGAFQRSWNIFERFSVFLSKMCATTYKCKTYHYISNLLTAEILHSIDLICINEGSNKAINSAIKAIFALHFVKINLGRLSYPFR